jgi:hypothetical protein
MRNVSTIVAVRLTLVTAPGGVELSVVEGRS